MIELQERGDIERLQAALEREFPSGAMSEVEQAAAQALMLLASYAADYPPQTSGARYRRTFTLGRLWTSARPYVSESAHVLEGCIGNATPYGPFVQDPVRQAAMHRGRWRTTEQIVRERAGEVDALLAQAGARIVERIAEAV